MKKNIDSGEYPSRQKSKNQTKFDVIVFKFKITSNLKK